MTQQGDKPCVGKRRKITSEEANTSRVRTCKKKVRQPTPFSQFITAQIKEKGTSQKELALAALMSEVKLGRLICNDNGRGKPCPAKLEDLICIGAALQLASKKEWEDFIFLAHPEWKVFWDWVSSKGKVDLDALNEILDKMGYPLFGNFE